MSGKIKTKSPWSLLPNFDSSSENTVRKSKSSTTTGSTSTKDNGSITITRMLRTTKSATTIRQHVAVATNQKQIQQNTVSKSSTSSVVVMRPNTLNVYSHEGQMAEAKLIIGEALNAWRAKARCNVVPAERLQELFHELQFNPSEKQISEMLQTAKVFARKGSRPLNGLTFGEFCVLAADLKRFRTCNFSSSNDPLKTISSLQNLQPRLDLEVTPTNSTNSSVKTTNSVERSCNSIKNQYTNFCTNNSEVNNKSSSSSTLSSIPLPSITTNTNTTTTQSSTNNSTSNSTAKQLPQQQTNQQVTTENIGPEVFLGGSCNPTTWRADVAIPTLQQLGISFYNPQVSDWTPDLIDLEYRAKEKARVLFFVMDSETRASAGAIEVAYIAGQNARQLVLVLHSYRPDQCIFNEPVSPQEYIDLSRNQQLLRELVTRRGLPVLDNIPQGLQRTKQILAGIRDPPTNIASILIVVRGAFDRVASTSSLDDEITLIQCQRALSFLGYAQSLLSLENLKSIIQSQKESLESCSSSSSLSSASSSSLAENNSIGKSNSRISLKSKREFRINFDEFCVLAAYLSVLQQEIHESGCISPIKGTNLPPPPIFLANMQESNTENAIQMSASFSKQFFRTGSSNSVPDERQITHSESNRSRDSGTSSPQPTLQEIAAANAAVATNQKSKYIHLGKRSKISLNVEFMNHSGSGGEPTPGEESDSNDSVFSSGSSINSYFCEPSGTTSFTGLEFRDVYLGGSCFLRTKWRQDCAIPFLNSKGITYHLPALHESIIPSQLNLPESVVEKTINEKKQCAVRMRRKERKNTQELLEDDDDDAGVGGSLDEEIEVDDENTWPLAIRPNLFNPSLLDSSRILLFVITNETRSLAPMTLAAHCIGLMYNVVLCVQMLPEFCMIDNEKLTPAAIKDYNRGRSYLIDLAKRQGVPVYNDLKQALDCVVGKVKASNSRNSV